MLLGDALHTAHFSIGSGTRLAMEDAIALSRALEIHGSDIRGALGAYEEARKPLVTKLIAAANASAQWYERFAQAMRLSPLDFAMSYLTRSGRVDAERLRRTSPEFMAAYEAHRRRRDEAPMTTIAAFDDVTVEAAGRIAILRLNDPKTLNAISPRMIGGLSQALAHIEAAGQGFRCAILTGTGRGFCSGANLTTTGPDDILGQGDLGRVLRGCYYPVLRQMRDFKMPLLVAVNGPALGFGLSLALMGDIVLAARAAFFQLTFSRIGLVPDGGAPWLLPRIIGMARTKELVILAERLGAEKALEWGLINQVHDEDKLMEASLALARELTERPTATLSLIRRAYWDSLDNSYEEQLELEAGLQTEAGKTGDFVEGVMAFREKRPPVFKGA